MESKDVTTVRRCTVAVIGNFNPAILHPEWFDRNQVLPAQEVREISEAKEDEIEGLQGLKIKMVRTNVFVSGTETRLRLPSYTILVNPERFEVIISNREKYEELCDVVAKTFKVLEHTPISSVGINFLSSLKFSEPARDLLHRYFCGQPATMSSIFGENYLIDSRIRYDCEDSRVTVKLELDEEKDEIGINFNYHKSFAEKEGTNELIAHLLEKHVPIILDADKVIKSLFGEPADGGKEE